MTAIERLQTALNGLGLKAVEARLEGLLEAHLNLVKLTSASATQLCAGSVVERQAQVWSVKGRSSYPPFPVRFAAESPRPSSEPARQAFP